MWCQKFVPAKKKKNFIKLEKQSLSPRGKNRIGACSLCFETTVFIREMACYRGRYPVRCSSMLGVGEEIMEFCFRTDGSGVVHQTHNENPQGA